MKRVALLDNKKCKKNITLIMLFCLVLMLLVGCNAEKDSSTDDDFDEKEWHKYSSKQIKEYFDDKEIGDTIIFGKYEADNDKENGKEDIEWYILDKQEDKVLLFSKYVLDANKYNEMYEGYLWEYSTIRQWLNNDFMNTAFDNEERKLINKSELSTSANEGKYEETEDYIFLLSLEEVEQYITLEKYIKGIPTDYAIARGVRVSTSDKGAGMTDWWIRHPGLNNMGSIRDVAYVSAEGSLDLQGEPAYFEDYGIRPALWISLEGVDDKKEDEIDNKDNQVLEGEPENDEEWFAELIGQGDSKEENKQPTVEVPPTIEPPSSYDDNEDAKKIELKMWIPSGDEYIIPVLCKQFDESHPEWDITFDYEICEEEEAYDRIVSNPNNVADIFYCESSKMSDLVEGGYVLQMSTKIEGQVMNNIDEKAIASCMIDNKLYGIPVYSNAKLLYYNKSLINKNVSMNSLIENKISGCKYNISFPIDDYRYLAAFYLGECYGENQYVNTVESFSYNSDEAVAITNYLNDMVNSQNFINDDVDGRAFELLKQKQLAAYIAGSDVSRDVKEALMDDYGVTMLPQMSYTLAGEQKKQMTPFAEYTVIAADRSTKYYSVVTQLAEYLASDYVQEVRVEARNCIPTNKQVIDYAKSGKYMDAAIIAGVNQMENLVELPNYRIMNNYVNAMNMLGKAISNQDVEVATDNATTRKFMIKIDEMIWN